MNKDLIVQFIVIGVVCFFLGFMSGILLERGQGVYKSELTETGHGIYHPVTGQFELIPVEDCQ